MSATGKLMLRGVADMRRMPLPQLCTLITVCMVALLAATGLLILHNVQTEVMRTQGQARFQMYWYANSNMTEVEGQWADLKHVPGVAELSTFTPRAAMAELMRGLSAAIPAKPAVPAAQANATANGADSAANGAEGPDAANATTAGATTAGATANATQAPAGQTVPAPPRTTSPGWTARTFCRPRRSSASPFPPARPRSPGWAACTPACATCPTWKR